MTFDREQVLAYSEKALDFITKKQVDDQEKMWFKAETLAGSKVNFNPGFLDYNKSFSGKNTVAGQEKADINLYDIRDRNYIDCTGGFGEYNIGQNHSRLIEIIREHLEQEHLYNWEFLGPLRAMLSRLLAIIAPGNLQNSFFTCSGVESIEGAIYLARKNTGRNGIITSAGINNDIESLSETVGKYCSHKHFIKQLPDTQNISFGDIEELCAVIASSQERGHEIAAIILEPILVEEGVVIPPDEYFIQVRDICTKHGIILIIDEVEAQMGRTGRLFAIEHYGVTPDIICLGKSFGGGVMPIGAIISTAKIWQEESLSPLMHSANFGGNPLACAAAIAGINVLLDQGLVEKAAEKGNYFLPKLQRMSQEYPAVKEARGKGLLIGIEFIDFYTKGKVARELFKDGIITAWSADKSPVIRIEPALTISIQKIDQLVELLEKAVKKVS